MINAAYYAEDMQLAEELSKIAFKEYFTTIRWYQTLTIKPGWKFNEARDGMLSLVEMAEVYGNNELSKQFQVQMKLIGLTVPKVPDEIEEEDEAPDSVGDSAK